MNIIVGYSRKIKIKSIPAIELRVRSFSLPRNLTNREYFDYLESSENSANTLNLLFLYDPFVFRFNLE